MKKLILHIGYPKTATTTLQHNLFKSLHDEGKIEWLHGNAFFNDNTLLNFSCENVLKALTGQKVETFTKDDVERELAEMDKITKDVSVISDEDLVFKFPGFSWANGQDALENAEKLKRIFTPYFDKIEILIGLRAQETIIQSYFLQCHTLIENEKQNYKDIGVFLKENFLKPESPFFFNYNNLIEEYERVFEKNNVHLLIFEDLIKDKAYFYSSLSELFLLEEDKVRSLFEKSVKNTTPKSKEGYIAKKNTWFYRNLIKPVRSKLRSSLNGDLYKKIHSLYRRVTPQSLRQKSIEVRSLTDQEKFEIRNKYKEGNRQLMANYGLSESKLRSYGYLE